ncbi:MAG: type II toxin-antitoxin system HicB family antitoxin [Gemmatimonadota bacterium]|nr:type II toxin-antitoxin system HicB family antitoxin [Gemmatimonadota bacterium]
MRYTIVVEKSPNNHAAYVPDLPGCVAAGTTKQDVIGEIRQAIALHIESLIEHGEPVPPPHCSATVLDVAIAEG